MVVKTEKGESGEKAMSESCVVKMVISVSVENVVIGEMVTVRHEVDVSESCDVTPFTTALGKVLRDMKREEFSKPISIETVVQVDEKTWESWLYLSGVTLA